MEGKSVQLWFVSPAPDPFKSNRCEVRPQFLDLTGGDKQVSKGDEKSWHFSGGQLSFNNWGTYPEYIESFLGSGGLEKVEKSGSALWALKVCSSERGAEGSGAGKMDKASPSAL